MSTVESPPNSSTNQSTTQEGPTIQDRNRRTIRYWDRRGKLNLLTGVRASQQAAWADRQTRKNREAEESHVRKAAWGSPEIAMSDEEMGDQIDLGDRTEHHYHSPPPATQSSGMAKTLAAAGLALAGLGAGSAIPIAAWNLTRPDTVVVDANEESVPSIEGSDTDTKYGLKIFRGQE